MEDVTEENIDVPIAGNPPENIPTESPSDTLESIPQPKAEEELLAALSAVPQAAASTPLAPPPPPAEKIDTPVTKGALPNMPAPVPKTAVPLTSPQLLQAFDTAGAADVKFEEPNIPQPVAEAPESEPSAGPKPFSAKDIPTGPPTTPKTPPILRAANMLNGGNAIEAAQMARTMMAETPPVPKAEKTPVMEIGIPAAAQKKPLADALPAEKSADVQKPDSQKAEEREETPFERNLRESGLKEALPRQDRPAPERATLSAQKDDGLPRIHTYAEDMGREIEKRGATISSIVLAEKARQPQQDEAPTPERRRSVLLILGSAILIVFGLGAVGGTIYYLTRTAPSMPAPAPTLIPVNHRASLEMSDQEPLAETLAKAKASTSINLGEVEAFDIEKNGIPLTASQILTALGAPDELTRNATGILVGVYAYNHTQPFILVSVSAYDLAFHAMLAWEPTVGTALGDFFAPPNVPIGGITTRAPSLSFNDTIIANLDARVSQSAWPILYAFPQQNLLLITTSENTVREVLTRLSLQTGN